MLYLTTRDKFDTYTVYRTLHEDTAPNGGLFFPFRLPAVSLETLKGKTFCECVADVLNLFFSAGLTGKEVEFSVGRYPKCASEDICGAALEKSGWKLCHDGASPGSENLQSPGEECFYFFLGGNRYSHRCSVWCFCANARGYCQ